MNYNMDMAEHVKGVAQFLSLLIGEQYMAKEQARETMDFLLTSNVILRIILMRLDWKRMLRYNGRSF